MELGMKNQISISRFRARVSNEWLKTQSFPIYLTSGAGNAKRVAFILSKAPVEPPLKIKEYVKSKIFGGPDTTEAPYSGYRLENKGNRG
jgi:hypothetical protein